MTNRILIVDDEPDIRELLEITLGRMSLTTSSAEDLASARHLLSTESFNLCLTDMRLPDGDGVFTFDLRISPGMILDRLESKLSQRPYQGTPPRNLCSGPP